MHGNANNMHHMAWPITPMGPSLSPDILRGEWPEFGTLRGQIWGGHRLILMLIKFELNLRDIAPF